MMLPDTFLSISSHLVKFRDFANFRMFLNLASTLNRGCKCNKDKLKEQVEQSYKTVLLKKKDDELFQKEIKQLLTNNEEESITFYYKEEEIFSLSL